MQQRLICLGGLPLCCWMAFPYIPMDRGLFLLRMALALGFCRFSKFGELLQLRHMCFSQLGLEGKPGRG